MAKAKPKQDIQNLSNATPEFLVDELGKIRDQQKILEKQEGFYKEALKARLDGRTFVDGEEYLASIATQERTSLDQQKIKEDMGDEWIKKYSKTTEFQVIRTNKKG